MLPSTLCAKEVERLIQNSLYLQTQIPNENKDVQDVIAYVTLKEVCAMLGLDMQVMFVDQTSAPATNTTSCEIEEVKIGGGITDMFKLLKEFAKKLFKSDSFKNANYSFVPNTPSTSDSLEEAMFAERLENTLNQTSMSSLSTSTNTTSSQNSIKSKASKEIVLLQKSNELSVISANPLAMKTVLANYKPQSKRLVTWENDLVNMTPLMDLSDYLQYVLYGCAVAIQRALDRLYAREGVFESLGTIECGWESVNVIMSAMQTQKLKVSKQLVQEFHNVLGACQDLEGLIQEEMENLTVPSDLSYYDGSIEEATKGAQKSIANIIKIANARIFIEKIFEKSSPEDNNNKVFDIIFKQVGSEINKVKCYFKDFECDVSKDVSKGQTSYHFNISEGVDLMLEFYKSASTSPGLKVVYQKSKSAKLRTRFIKSQRYSAPTDKEDARAFVVNTIGAYVRNLKAQVKEGNKMMDGGKKTKQVKVLGRLRNVYRKGNVQYVKVNGKFMTLQRARALEKQK